MDAGQYLGEYGRSFGTRLDALLLGRQNRLGRASPGLVPAHKALRARLLASPDRRLGALCVIAFEAAGGKASDALDASLGVELVASPDDPALPGLVRAYGLSSLASGMLAPERELAAVRLASDALEEAAWGAPRARIFQMAAEVGATLGGLADASALGAYARAVLLGVNTPPPDALGERAALFEAVARFDVAG